MSHCSPGGGVAVNRVDNRIQRIPVRKGKRLAVDDERKITVGLFGVIGFIREKGGIDELIPLVP